MLCSFASWEFEPADSGPCRPASRLPAVCCGTSAPLQVVQVVFGLCLMFFGGWWSYGSRR